ncbi:hypothetical protein GJ496_007437 [Pomphorhynchus laevis]|nr:hypothetical protein GJ496_007437 [Pomphorhynchus laevis]
MFNSFQMLSFARINMPLANRVLFSRTNALAINTVKPLMLAAGPLNDTNRSVVSNQFHLKRNSSTFLPANKQWITERLVGAQIALLLPSIFLMPSKLAEGALVTFIVMHAHWGMEHVIVDYVPNKLQKTVMMSLWIASGAALSGFMYFVLNDIGIAESFKRIWAI